MCPITQAPKNLAEPLTGNMLVTFTSFDRIIEEHVRKKMMMSFRMMYEKDIPLVVEGLREWLIKSVGCFMTVGHCRLADLAYWYESDAVIEEFDDLLLEFKDYLESNKGIDPKKDYTLLRYGDNLTFILMEGKNGLDLPNPLVDLPDPNAELCDRLKGRFDEFVEKLVVEFEDSFDVYEFMGELAPEELIESLFKKQMAMRQMDEQCGNILLQYSPIVPGGKTL